MYFNPNTFFFELNASEIKWKNIKKTGKGDINVRANDFENLMKPIGKWELKYKKINILGKNIKLWEED